MYKKILSILACSFLTFNLFACSSASTKANSAEQTTIKFSWWGGQDRHDKTMKAINAFEEAYPNIKVKVEYSEWTGFKKKMNINVLGNNEPDLMQINYDWLQTYSSDGTGFYDLNKVSDVLDLNNFSSDVLNYGTKNGVLNGIPISMNSKVVYYNKTALDKYGMDKYKTYDQLLSSKSSITDDKYPLELDTLNLWFFCMAYVQQKTGHDFINEDATLGFTESDIKELLGFYKTMLDSKIIPSVNTVKDYNFSDNSSAASMAWTTDADKNKKNLSKNDSECVTGELPAINGQNPITYVKPGMLYAISKNTEHPKEAALLMNFLLNNSDAVTNIGLDRGIPCSSSALATLSADGQLKGIQYEANETVSSSTNVLISPYLENTELQKIYTEALEDVSFGTSSVDEISTKTYNNLVQTLKSVK